MGTNDDEVESSRSKSSRHETVEEVLLLQIHHEFLLWEGCHRDVKSRMGYDGEIDDMLRIRLHKAGSDEEIFIWTTGYDKIQKNDLWLLSMFDAKHQNRYANVAWVIARWMKRKGDRTQKESQICCRQFISKIARKCRVLTEDVVRSLSALIYCRDLDTTTLRDLIDSDDILIPEDPQPAVTRVGIPRPSRASMQDLYDRMGRMEIRQEGDYNPHGYAQPQYDQYYQQCPPPPPQYQ
ncbi:hypothetical protein Tco_0514890 [Tanacetum coccineum]